MHLDPVTRKEDGHNAKKTHKKEKTSLRSLSMEEKKPQSLNTEV